MDSEGVAQRRRRIVVEGPLAPFADGLREDLADQGFATDTIVDHVHRLADLSGWLSTHGLSPAALTNEVVREFQRARRAAGGRVGVNERALAPLLGTVTGKNDQTRMVPLHATTVAMLAGYAARRDRLCPTPVSPGFFLTATGRRAQQGGAQQIFARLVTAADIHTPPGRRRPRIHDLRHTFAVNVLIGWYEAGVDVAARLPVLSAFLGHSSPEATYWYLQATPQLLALAAQRLDAASDKRPADRGEVSRP